MLIINGLEISKEFNSWKSDSGMSEDREILMTDTRHKAPTYHRYCHSTRATHYALRSGRRVGRTGDRTY